MSSSNICVLKNIYSKTMFSGDFQDNLRDKFHILLPHFPCTTIFIQYSFFSS